MSTLLYGGMTTLCYGFFHTPVSSLQSNLGGVDFSLSPQEKTLGTERSHDLLKVTELISGRAKIQIRGGLIPKPKPLTAQHPSLLVCDLPMKLLKTSNSNSYVS